MIIILTFYSSAASTAINHYGNTHCIVYPNGEVLWVPPTQFSVLCDFDLTFWPFDRQTCNLKFGSWTYHGLELDLQLYSNETEARHTYIQYELINLEKYRVCCCIFRLNCWLKAPNGKLKMSQSREIKYITHVVRSHILMWRTQ